ncbi:MAG: Gfo/Idh/MocA family oxidoreductase [Planctomycetota bacterium]|jgi:predicted dehydrogenase|nr:Gfo/Idh/MocA family oxidoreductase [Planctomycetota bacterium]
MTLDFTRRGFLRFTATSAALIAASRTATARHLFNGGKLRHAHVGVGGMGRADLGSISSHPDLEVVALCDVDANHLAAAAKLHPNAKIYADWREMFQEMATEIDSVCVSTPDHMHAPVTMTAMSLGKHVYCQKPLTHTVKEARLIGTAAANSRVMTQMGIQNHSGGNYLSTIETFNSGITGPVSDVHVWSDRPAGWWPQGEERPEGSDSIPEHLSWDLWLGVAPERPYKAGRIYHPFAWRGRKDFGTGAQGDMACHLMDPAPWFLGLKDPLTVKSVGPKPTADCFPLWSRVSYRFPATPKTHKDGVNVTWHDGGKNPAELVKEYQIENLYSNGSLFVGPKGALLVSPYEPCRFFKKGEGEVEFERVTVKARDHYHQWVDACFGRDHCTAAFGYSAHLTEVALLGNIALEFPNEELRWNPKEMRFDGNAKATKMVHKPYRSGWEVPRLK